MTNAPDPRQVSYLPLSALKGDPRNPKAHDLETIDASIGRFGVLDLIVKDERTGYIISGHGRRTTLSAMRDRGENPPEGVKVDEDTGEWLVPVVTGWASRTDAEAAAALIALNRTTELGGWVDDALLELLDELDDVEDGYVGVGFTEEDRAALETLTYSAEEDGPRDLDDLHAVVGDPTPEDSMERVVLTLYPEIAERLRAVVGRSAEEQDEAVRAWLLHAEMEDG